jgi:hypothetical protein
MVREIDLSKKKAEPEYMYLFAAAGAFPCFGRYAY